MHQRATRIRNIFHNFFKQNRIESFEEYKQAKIEEIIELIKPCNFDTPEKASNTYMKMQSKKMAYQDIEEYKRIADELDLKQVKK